MESMVAQHLDLYDWGTSNPIYSSLVSGFVQSRSTRGPTISGVGLSTAVFESTVGGFFNTGATDARLLTTINCGEGSYLERVRRACFAGTVGRALTVARRRMPQQFWLLTELVVFVQCRIFGQTTAPRRIDSCTHLHAPPWFRRQGQRVPNVPNQPRSVPSFVPASCSSSQLVWRHVRLERFFGLSSNGRSAEDL